MIADQNTSPYDLEQLLKISRERLILVAQNHWFMTRSDNNEKFWELTKRALSRGVEVDIIGMHRDARPPDAGGGDIPDAFELWALYQHAPAFNTHAGECWTALKTWAERYQKLSETTENTLGTLRIFGAYFTPLTISVVDPDTDRGLIVLSPRTSSQVSMARPQIILRRKYDEAAFKYYRQSIDNASGNEGWKRMFV